MCSHPEERVKSLKRERDKLIKAHLEKEMLVNQIDEEIKEVNAKLKYIEDQLQLLGFGQQEMEV